MIITSEMLDLPEIEPLNLTKEQNDYVITCCFKADQACCPTCDCTPRSIHTTTDSFRTFRLQAKQFI